MNETDNSSRNKLIIFNANNLSEINLAADFTCDTSGIVVRYGGSGMSGSLLW